MYDDIKTSVKNVKVKSQRPHPDGGGKQPQVEMGQFLTTPGEPVARETKNQNFHGNPPFHFEFFWFCLGTV